VVEGSIDSLQVLQRSLQTPEFDASFDKAVALMAEAPTLWLVASRRSFPVGAYLAYALQHTGKPVHWLHGLGHMQTDQLRALRPGDVMIAISFEPYARETLEVVSAGCDRGALLLAITDSRLSPLVQLSQVALLVQDSSTFGFRSLTSTLSMVQSLFLGLAYKLELAYEQGSSQR
jgi:DNA-binding MurR/RpiR family transcriptional regulator